MDLTSDNMVGRFYRFIPSPALPPDLRDAYDTVDYMYTIHPIIVLHVRKYTATVVTVTSSPRIDEDGLDNFIPIGFGSHRIKPLIINRPAGMKKKRELPKDSWAVLNSLKMFDVGCLTEMRHGTTNAHFELAPASLERLVERVEEVEGWQYRKGAPKGRSRASMGRRKEASDRCSYECCPKFRSQSRQSEQQQDGTPHHERVEVEDAPVPQTPQAEQLPASAESISTQHNDQSRSTQKRSDESASITSNAAELILHNQQAQEIARLKDEISSLAQNVASLQTVCERLERKLDAQSLEPTGRKSINRLPAQVQNDARKGSFSKWLKTLWRKRHRRF